jgi:uncharacterized protein
MLRVTADTNIYISALNFGGKPLSIIDAARRGEFEMAISESILAEILGVLRRKFQRPANDLDFIERQIREFTLVVEPEEQLHVITQDPTDNRILECAVASSADYIVSGDAHLLKPGGVSWARVLGPSRFLEVHAEALRSSGLQTTD